jgi:hypothetical protein
VQQFTSEKEPGELSTEGCRVRFPNIRKDNQMRHDKENTWRRTASGRGEAVETVETMETVPGPWRSGEAGQGGWCHPGLGAEEWQELRACRE